VTVSATGCETSGFTVDRTGDYASARLTLPMSACTLCNGTGLVRTTVTDNGRSYDTVTSCSRARLGRRSEAFNAAHLPAVHAASTFDNWRPGNAEQARAHGLVKDFALRWPQGRAFILSGPVGTGKTHLLVAALRHLTLELGVRAGYVEISLLYAQIRRGFQDGKSGGEIIGPLSQLDVLAIDELGKGRGSVFELETLDELIARRYNANKITLFATNYSVRAPEDRAQRGLIDTAELIAAGKESKLLVDRVGDRIYSRLCEMCEFVEFPANTPDARRSPGLRAKR
jgi:DNA replication protein DnaC